MRRYVAAGRGGRWTRGVDALVGASRDHVLIYVDGPTQVPGVGVLDRGYHRLEVVRDGTGFTTCGDPIPDLASYGPATSEVLIVISRLHGNIVDMDCDFGGAEYDICPPPPTWSRTVRGRGTPRIGASPGHTARGRIEPGAD